MKGIDVSKHQGKIDWKKVKNDGIEFAMLRAGFGKNNIDEFFHQNAKGCTQNGIPFGAYWFSYAYTEEMARKEAEYCVAALKDYTIRFPVCYDLEYDSVAYAREKGVTITKSLATKMANAFCGEIKAAGYIPMYYANKDYMQSMFGTVPYDLWYARYASEPGRKDISIWQYTSSGSVSGISGKVDMDISYKEYLGGDEMGEWIEENGRWWYRHADGGYTRDNWEFIDGQWYLFDADGWMLTGWQMRNGVWYYLSGKGSMETGWQNTDGAWYFMEENGAMRTGWIQDGGVWYYLEADGKLVSGSWKEVNGQWYHLGYSGAMDTGLFRDTDGRLYYLAEDGHMCRTDASGALV